MNSKWTFDSTDDPAILILLECLRLNDKIVPTTAAVEKALLMALELLDKDVAPGSISEMFILNHLSGSYEPPTIPSSSPIVPVSDTHDKESSEVQAEK